MNNKRFEDVVNQYVEILMYDIHIKTYELKKNKDNVDNADLIFKYYYDSKIKEFKINLDKAKKLYCK
jgi:hypothetical protein